MSNRYRENADELIASAIASGSTIAQAATFAKVSEKTVRRRLDSPEFSARVATLQRKAIGRAMGELTDGASEGVKTLRGLLTAQSESVRLGAARSLIELCLKTREAVALEERLAIVEARFAAQQECQT
jgi:hypothetical protein